MPWSLDNYIFSYGPDKVLGPNKRKFVSHVDTWASVASFAFDQFVGATGTTILGSEIVLGWQFMRVAEFNNIEAKLSKTTSMIFITNIPTSYMVLIKELKKEILLPATTAFSNWYQNVEMLLVVVGTSQ